MRCFLAALRFLTVAPVPGTLGTAEKDLAGSLWFFPLIGLLAGTAVAVLTRIIALLLPPSLTGLSAVILLLAVSGALHLDGLADCADGFFSSRPREKMLEIMRDSHIGVMGVIALILLTAAKYLAIQAIIDPNTLFKALIIAPLFARSAIIITMVLLPYARPEGGLASLFYAEKCRGPALAAFFAMSAGGWLIAGRQGLLAAGISLLVLGLFSGYCYRKIGGTTGDTLGAVCELVETVSLVGFSLTIPF